MIQPSSNGRSPERHASFDVHGLVHVSLSPDLAPDILKSSRFQVGWFESEGPVGGTGPSIQITPYRSFSSPQATQFHHLHGSHGAWCDHGDRGLSLARDGDSIRVHTDDPNFLLNYLINDLLLPQGVAMSHAGGVVSPEGKAILLPGAGGVGKTTLALRLVERHGFRFLGDDIVLLDEQGHCLAFPRALVLKPGFGDILPGLAEQLGIEDPGLAAAEPTLPGASAISSGNIPLRGAIRAGLERIGVRALVSRWVHGTRRLAVVPSEDIFSPDQVVECAPLGSVVFLERSDGRRPQVTPISRDALIGRMSSILLYEWSDYMRDVFTWSSLGLTDFPAHVSRLCNVFRKGLPEHGTLLRIPQTSSVEDLESAALRAIEGGSS